MLASKTLTLAEIGSDITSMPTVIKSEDRQIISSYESYIFNKTLEADSIIEDAHKTAETIATQAREEAEQKFWKTATAFYNDLEALKAEIIDSVEQQCRNVVVACLKEVVHTIPPEEKLKPMIESLLNQNINDDAAKILVNPEQMEFVESIMANIAVPFEADPRVELDTVVLKSEKSDYKASFQGKLDTLIRSLETK